MTNTKISETERIGKVKISIEDYHADSATGSTDIKNTDRSPAHQQYEKNNPSESSEDQKLGQALHDAQLEPALFMQKYVVMPEFVGLTQDGRESTQSKEAKLKRAAWCSEQGGKIIISADEYNELDGQINGMLKSIKSHSAASKLLSSGRAEESYFWIDPQTGVRCKCRPDYLRDGKIIVDIKTTGDASRPAFERTISKFGYHISAAWYLDGVSAVTGDKYDTFIFVVVEKKPPYAVAVYYLDDEDIRDGRETCRKNIEVIAACQMTGLYPSYDEHITSIKRKYK